MVVVCSQSVFSQNILSADFPDKEISGFVPWIPVILSKPP
jgi:hypothetical protein